ncbi:hypothetical protein BaRGS_00011639 [Batillaria attramentaria]|uniref:Uncharacterized protein n=1 Tax=Batillaria attramentaria TaxID=370345 RepID=A0ABD0LDN7_9CAEN
MDGLSVADHGIQSVSFVKDIIHTLLADVARFKADLIIRCWMTRPIATVGGGPVKVQWPQIQDSLCTVIAGPLPSRLPPPPTPLPPPSIPSPSPHLPYSPSILVRSFLLSVNHSVCLDYGVFAGLSGRLRHQCVLHSGPDLQFVLAGELPPLTWISPYSSISPQRRVILPSLKIINTPRVWDGL